MRPTSENLWLVSGKGIEGSVARYTENSVTVATAVSASVTSSRLSSAQ
jgi:hypothetical protein